MRTRTMACLMLLASAAALRAQEGMTTLTLDEAMARGVANSLRLAELQARRDAFDAVEKGRGADRRPAVSLQGGYTRTNHVEEFVIVQPGQLRQVVYPDLPDNFRTRLDLLWLIYSGGSLDALERAARAEREAAGEELVAARADLRLEITRAFWALVTAREAEQVLARSLESIRSYVGELRARLAQGLIPPNELLSAEAQQSRERVFSIEATNDRRIAEANLKRLLGMDGPTEIAPAPSPDPVAAPPVDQDLLIAEAIAARPERRALDDRVEAARARLAAAGGGLKPHVALNGGYDYARPNPRHFPRSAEWRDSWDVSVNASWTLWDGGRTKADQAEASASVRAAESRLADFDRQVTFEVRQRALELQSSLAAITASADGVRAAAEARRVVGERYNAGVATNTEVLDAQTALLQAELDRTRAVAGARMAEARLARAVGR